MSERNKLPQLRVLMVCTGNICRSPTAEGILRHKLREAGLDDQVEVDSAGTESYHVGHPPDPRSHRHALARGYDLSGQSARRLTKPDFQQFDWLVAMDKGHLRDMLRQCPPEFTGRVRLLMDFAGKPGVDVPDPYYGSVGSFERVLDLVEEGCDGLMQELRRQLG
jgi:protein-tyrosine phosphatase